MVFLDVFRKLQNALTLSTHSDRVRRERAHEHGATCPETTRRGQFPRRHSRTGATHQAGQRINEDDSFDRCAIALLPDQDEHAGQCVSCAELWWKNVEQLRQHAVRALAGSGRGWCHGSWC